VETRFSAPIQTCPGTHPAPYAMGTGVKQLGCCVNHSPIASAEVEE